MARHEAHLLYDSACDLLMAAQRMRGAAQRPGIGEAIPATLGCLGAAVEELAVCTTGLADELRPTVAIEALDRVTEQLLVVARECDNARAITAERGSAQPAPAGIRGRRA